VVKELFDFKETAKRALGPHWNNINDIQREEFTEVFIAVLKDIYLNKSDTYAGEKIVFVREIVEGNRGKVRTNLYITSEKKVVVDFSMQLVDGVWKTYDLQIEGVSIISNYRSQFNSFLAKNSFEKLMEDLIEKQKSL
jgi:phospholipid transport system substrate-binding protein